MNPPPSILNHEQYTLTLMPMRQRRFLEFINVRHKASKENNMDRMVLDLSVAVKDSSLFPQSGSDDDLSALHESDLDLTRTSTELPTMGPSFGKVTMAKVNLGKDAVVARSPGNSPGGQGAVMI